MIINAYVSDGYTSLFIFCILALFYYLKEIGAVQKRRVFDFWMPLIMSLLVITIWTRFLLIKFTWNRAKFSAMV